MLHMPGITDSQADGSVGSATKCWKSSTTSWSVPRIVQRLSPLQSGYHGAWCFSAQSRYKKNPGFDASLFWLLGCCGTSAIIGFLITSAALQFVAACCHRRRSQSVDFYQASVAQLCAWHQLQPWSILYSSIGQYGYCRINFYHCILKPSIIIQRSSFRLLHLTSILVRDGVNPGPSILERFQHEKYIFTTPSQVSSHGPVPSSLMGLALFRDWWSVMTPLLIYRCMAVSDDKSYDGPRRSSSQVRLTTINRWRCPYHKFLSCYGWFLLACHE